MNILFADNFQLLAFVIIFLSALIVNYLLFRSLLFNLFDPFWLIILGLTTTLAWLGYEFWIRNSLTGEVMTYLIIAQVAFILGAKWGQYFFRSLHFRLAINTPACRLLPSAWEKIFIKTFLFLSSGAVLIVFLIRAHYLGLGLLSGDPEMARVLANRGGFGVLGRITAPLIYCNLVFLFYVLRTKIRMSFSLRVIYFLIPAVYIFFMGSKSGFIAFFLAFYFSNVFVSLRERKLLDFVSFKIAGLVALSILGFSVLILYLRASSVGVENHGRFAVQQLVARIFGSGHGPVYYFTENLSAFMRFPPAEYIWRYLVVPFLAPLRLVNYPSKSLGSALGYLVTGSDFFGPNPTMFVEGWAFFGDIGGVFYCFALGVLLAICRYWACVFKIQNNLFQLVAFCLGNVLILAIPFDMLLFWGDIFNYILVLLPLALFCIVLSLPALRSLNSGRVKSADSCGKIGSC